MLCPCFEDNAFARVSHNIKPQHIISRLKPVYSLSFDSATQMSGGKTITKRQCHRTIFDWSYFLRNLPNLCNYFWCSFIIFRMATIDYNMKIRQNTISTALITFNKFRLSYFQFMLWIEKSSYIFLVWVKVFFWPKKQFY